MAEPGCAAPFAFVAALGERARSAELQSRHYRDPNTIEFGSTPALAPALREAAYVIENPMHEMLETRDRFNQETTVVTLYDDPEPGTSHV